MDKLKRRLEVANAAFDTLREALAVEQPSSLERDGAIQRFEYSFEALWKACQTYLEQVEGVQCASPRACLRAMGAVGLMNTGETVAALAMADDRNLTVPTYNEVLARKIWLFRNICGYDRMAAFCNSLSRIVFHAA